MTPPQTVTEWIQQMRADEAAMTEGPWKSAAWDVERTVFLLIKPDGEPLAESFSEADVAGIVAARNSLRRMVDCVEAAVVLAEFAKTAPGCLPGRVTDAIATLALLVRP